MPVTPILNISGLSKRFAGIPALSEASLELLPGEVHALAGENGAGKSTLINIMSGLLQADSGRIMCDGAEVQNHSPGMARKLGIRVIFQDFDLAPNLSVGDNILLGQEPASRFGFIRRSRNSQCAVRALARVGLDIHPATPVSRLTAAQRQLVAIARAVASETRILVMDEPTSALAADDIDPLLDLVLELKAAGITTLFISHKLDEVFRIADRITVLRDGCTVACRPARLSSRDEIISLMVGREISNLFSSQARETGAVLLEVRGLRKKGRFHDISFSLRRGEVLGIYGLKGAGRSAMAKALFGLSTPDGGEISINGQATRINSCQDAIRNGIGLVPEDRKELGIFPNMDLEENLSIAALDEMSTARFIRPDKELAATRKWIRELDIRSSGPRQNIMRLSGGNQQKVILARWLATHPDVLILDEPTVGIDVGAKSEIYHLIGKLLADGMGIILISSELPEMLGLSDRILVMHTGRIVKEFSAITATEEKIMQAIHA